MILILSALIGAGLANQAASQPSTAAPSATSSPADWRRLGESQGATIDWNAAAIERGPTMIVTVRFTPPASQGTSYSVTRVEIDCAGGRAHAILTTNYRADGTTGRIDTVPVPYESIPPGSMFDILRRAVC
jgi:hypothetical protein